MPISDFFWHTFMISYTMAKMIYQTKVIMGRRLPYWNSPKSRPINPVRPNPTKPKDKVKAKSTTSKRQPFRKLVS